MSDDEKALVLAPANDRPAATVYFDGSCPLCRMEIGYYSARDTLRAIRFIDISLQGADTGKDLDRSAAMARFHVRAANGELVSGAAAFVALWRQLPRWRVIARLASMPGILCALERSYVVFLKVRPSISSRLRKAGF